jgi:hypothetical protein
VLGITRSDLEFFFSSCLIRDSSPGQERCELVEAEGQSTLSRTLSGARAVDTLTDAVLLAQHTSKAENFVGQEEGVSWLLFGIWAVEAQENLRKPQ